METMTSNRSSGQDEPSFLFSLDVLVRGKTNGQALEQLLALLNDCPDVLDCRINGEIRLGAVIEESLRVSQANGAATGALEKMSPAAQKGRETPATGAPAAAGAGKSPAGAGHRDAASGGTAGRTHRPRGQEPQAQSGGRHEAAGNSPAPAAGEKPVSPLIGQIFRYITDRNLVRLTVVKGRGVKLDMPCRILNYDESLDSMTVYHVDEKKVYTVRLTEIDEMTAS